MARFEAVNGRSQLMLDAETNVIHPVHTTAEELKGYFEAELAPDGSLDLSVMPRGHMEVRVENLRSDNPLLDRTMQGRLNTRRFPSIKANLVESHETGEKGQYRAVGDISFHGVTRRLKDDLHITFLDEDTVKISGETTIDVRDFDVVPPKLLFLKVEPEVKVILTFVAERVN